MSCSSGWPVQRSELRTKCHYIRLAIDCSPSRFGFESLPLLVLVVETKQHHRIDIIITPKIYHFKITNSIKKSRQLVNNGSTFTARSLKTGSKVKCQGQAKVKSQSRPYGAHKISAPNCCPTQTVKPFAPSPYMSSPPNKSILLPLPKKQIPPWLALQSSAR